MNQIQNWAEKRGVYIDVSKEFMAKNKKLLLVRVW